MWCFYGNGTWSWLCLIPFLVMLGFMVMMFVMARRWCSGWMGAWGSGERMTGGVKDGKSICTQMEGHAGLHDAILHGDDEPQDAGGNA